jgi:hypothetical protein
MKKIVAIFSVLALFSVAAVAQDLPKNTVKKKPATTSTKIKPNKTIGKKVMKANAPAAKMNTKEIFVLLVKPCSRNAAGLFFSTR